MPKPLRFALIGFACVVSSLAGAQGSHLVRGTVRDSATNAFVTGAVILFSGSTVAATVRSDEAGEFQLAVPAGGYRVTVRRLGYAILTRDISLPDADTSIRLVIAPIPRTLTSVRVRGKGSGIYGVVGTLSGLHPIPGAKVQVAGAKQQALTDSAGAFYFDVAPGSYMLRMTRAGYSELLFP